MKKVLSVMLALIMIFSNATSAFASYSRYDIMVLAPENPESDTVVAHKIKNENGGIFYVYDGGTFYVALPDRPYENFYFSSPGPIQAEIVEYDPEKIIIDGMDVKWSVTCNGETVESRLGYNEAKAKAAVLNEENNGNYDVVPENNVTIVKFSVEPNLSEKVESYGFTIYAYLENRYIPIINTVIHDNVFGDFAESNDIPFRDNDMIPLTGAPVPSEEH